MNFDNIFLDTSSLFKLYHIEQDTQTIDNIFLGSNVKTIYLSALTEVEFTSTAWKKVRIKEINELKANEIIGHYRSDRGKYTFLPVDDVIIEQARNLIAKYGIQGLRTLDSLQLSTAVYLRNDVNLFITSDKLMNTFFEAESLPTLKNLG